MHSAVRMERFQPSATMAVSAKAMELRSQGREIVSLSVGEPDFVTPDHVCEAAKKAIDERFTRYTQVPGVPDLRDAAAQYFNKFYKADVSGDNIIITNGGKQALFNCMEAVLGPGDKVLLPAPYWVSYPAMISLADAQAVVVESGVESDYKVTVEQLDQAYDPAVRMLILNSPSNPTGVQYAPQELTDIVEWAVNKDILVLSDEIYDRLVYDPVAPFSLSSLWKKHPEHIAVVNGLSKSFAMTGWRVGYLMGCPELIKFASKVQGQVTSCICSVTQKAALAALSGPFDFIDEMRAAFVRRRDLAMDIVSGWSEAVCPTPGGAFYIFPDVSGYYRDGMSDSASLCNALLEKAGVAAVPGSAFGNDNCVRFSYALDDETLIKGLKAVGDTLAGKT